MAGARNFVTRASLGSSRRLLTLAPVNRGYASRSCVSALPSQRVVILPKCTSQSFHSTALRFSNDTRWADKGKIPYKELKPITEAPTGEITIIDVREPDEVSAGMIPSAVNVPLTQFEKAFTPNGGADFQEKFAFPRPSFNDPIVFYCRSGKRSEQALQVAKKNGWHNARNYEGSWLDWVQQEENKK